MSPVHYRVLYITVWFKYAPIEITCKTANVAMFRLYFSEPTLLGSCPQQRSVFAIWRHLNSAALSHTEAMLSLMSSTTMGETCVGGLTMV